MVNRYRKLHVSMVNAQRGFTLVELLVGLLLSLFIVGVSLTYMVSSSQSFRAQTNDDYIQENARYSLETISRNLRLAGLDPVDIGNVEPMNVIFSEANCPDSAIGATGGTTNETACTVDNLGVNNSDRIAIDYKSAASTVTTTSGVSTQTRTCNDQAVTDGQHVVSTFWVGESDNDMNSLYCQAYDVETGERIGLGVPLIDGIDAMQVQYGVDTDDDGKVNVYQSFARFSADGTTDTEDIKTIRLALLINSGLTLDADANTEAQAERTYSLLDGPELTFDDRVARQVYSTTVLLPNNL